MIPIIDLGAQRSETFICAGCRRRRRREFFFRTP